MSTEPTEIIYDRRRPSSGGRRSFLRGKIGLLIYPLAIVLIVVAYSYNSPRVSYGLLKVGIKYHSSFLVDLLVQRDKVGGTIAAAVAPLLMSPGQRPSTNEQQILQNIVSDTLQTTIPFLLNATGETANAPTPPMNNNPISHMLPLLLQIEPQAWKSWNERINMGHYSMQSCKHTKNRAACEVVIDGPPLDSNEPNARNMASIALLWERSGVLWHLQGIAGLENLVQQMRIPLKK